MNCTGRKSAGNEKYGGSCALFHTAMGTIGDGPAPWPAASTGSLRFPMLGSNQLKNIKKRTMNLFMETVLALGADEVGSIGSYMISTYQPARNSIVQNAGKPSVLKRNQDVAAYHYMCGLLGDHCLLYTYVHFQATCRTERRGPFARMRPSRWDRPPCAHQGPTISVHGLNYSAPTIRSNTHCCRRMNRRCLRRCRPCPLRQPGAYRRRRRRHTRRRRYRKSRHLLWIQRCPRHPPGPAAAASPETMSENVLPKPAARFIMAELQSSTP